MCILMCKVSSCSLKSSLWFLIVTTASYIQHIVSSDHQAEFLRSPSGKLFDKIVYRPTTEDTAEVIVHKVHFMHIFM